MNLPHFSRIALFTSFLLAAGASVAGPAGSAASRLEALVAGNAASRLEGFVVPPSGGKVWPLDQFTSCPIGRTFSEIRYELATGAGRLKAGLRTSVLASTSAAGREAGTTERASWRVGILANSGRYSRADGSDLAGFDVELLRAGARVVESEIEFTPVDSMATALEQLATGEVDAVAGLSFDRAAELAGKAVFSAPYRTESLRGFVRSEALFRDSGDLPHASIAVPAGTTAHAYAVARGWKVVETASWAAAFERVARGGAEAVLCDPGIASQQLPGDFRVLPGVVHEAPIGVAVRTGADFRLAEGLGAVLRTGHADHLANQWGLTPEATPKELAIDFRVLGYGALVLIAALLVLSRSDPGRRRRPAGATTGPAIPLP